MVVLAVGYFHRAATGPDHRCFTGDHGVDWVKWFYERARMGNGIGIKHMHGWFVR